MTEDPKGDTPVEGERRQPAGHRERSLQSRLTSLLAAVAAGVLTWYYAGMLAHQAHAREAARAGSAARAQGEMPLPPLPVPDPDPPPPAAGPLGAVLLPASLGSVPATAPDAGLPAGSVKSPAQLLRERQLSGSVFARQSAGGPQVPTTEGAGQGDPTSLPPSAFPAALTGAGGQGAAGPALATLLHPAVTPAVQARLLPTQRFLLPRGAFIDCTLEAAIDSSLPGMTSCVTATDTFGADGRVVLLERGTRLAGETRGQVAQGTARIFVAWTEARTPRGVVVPLDSPGADELGRSGLPGTVSRHFWDRFGAAVLVSMLDGGVQAAVQAGNRGGGTILYDPAASQSVLTESLKSTIDIPPTVLKPNGDRIQVMVARDLDFRAVYELRTRE